MKVSYNAKILGHKIFSPGKDCADAVKLHLAVSCDKVLGKAIGGALQIPLEDLPQFQTGRHLRITVEDSQQVLKLEKAAKKGAEQQVIDNGAEKPVRVPECSVDGCQKDSIDGDRCEEHQLDGPKELLRDPGGGRRRRGRSSTTPASPAH